MTGDVMLDTTDASVELARYGIDLSLDADSDLIEIEKQTILVTEEPEIEIITEAEQGPQGPPGPPGADGYAIPNLLAGEALLGHRAVRMGEGQRVFYASASSLEHINSILGITTNAAVADGPVFVQTYGEIEEPSWNWAVNQPIYLGTSGALTQVAPAAGFILILGHAITPTRMFVSKQQPIQLM